jgi:hypothetical protein
MKNWLANRVNYFASAKSLSLVLSLLLVACSQHVDPNTIGETEINTVVNQTTKTEVENSQQSLQENQLLNTSPQDKKTQDALSALDWVHSVDVEHEVEDSISDNDFRLFVIAKRGPNVPGIELDQQEELKALCGERYLDGVGDVVYGDAHKKLYASAIQFASEFNERIVKSCKEHK